MSAQELERALPARYALRVSLVALCLASFACRPPRPSQTVVAPAAQGFVFNADQFIVRASESPIVELRLVFDAGSADDPKGREGLSYVMLKSMLEGRAGNLSYSERARALYPMAAMLDGHVGREQSVLSARVHRDHLAGFYPLLRDVLLAPAFDESDVERVRAHALSSLTQDLRGSDDEELGKQALQAMLYEGGPDAHPELGTESGLGALRAGDVAAHFARVLCARRLRVALSGPVSEAFVGDLKRDLATLERPACVAAANARTHVARAARVLIVDKPEAQSIAISFGLASEVTRSHPDYAALTLAAAFLGQHRTFAGLLMRKVREDRGLNYGDYAYAEHFEQDGDSRFPAPNVARKKQYISFWLRPMRPDQAHFALRLALRELGRVVHEGLSEGEFTRIQSFADRYYALFAQTEQERLGNALDDRFYDRPTPHLDTLRAAFRALTREQLNAAIKRHIALDKLQIAIVAPDAQHFAKALTQDEPSPIKYSSEKPAEILEEDKAVATYPLGLRDAEVRIVPVAQMFY
jgi:zinc protease